MFMILAVTLLTGFIQYARSNESSGKSWAEATKSCGNDGLEYNPNTLINMQKLSGKTFWVGLAVYHQMSSWMEMLGCYDNIQSHTELQNVSSVGSCQRECQEFKYFGYQIQSKICKCMSEENYKGSLRVPPIRCVNVHMSSLPLFVYTNYNETIVNNSNSTAKCVTSTCIQGSISMTAKECEDKDPKTQSLCENGEIIPDQNWQLTQKKSLTDCIEKKNKILIASTYCQGLYQNPTWTNIIREEIEIELHLGVPQVDENRPCMCISAYINSILIPLRTNCELRIHEFVCLNRNVTDVSSVTSKATVNAKVHMEGQTVEPTTVRDGFNTIPFTSKIEKEINHVENNVGPAYNLGLIFGVAVASIVIVSVVTTIIFCRIRSIGIFGKIRTRQSNEHNVSKPTCPLKVSYNVYQNNSLLDISLRCAEEQDTQKHFNSQNLPDQYAQVEKMKKPLGAQNFPESTYGDSLYSVYDRLNNKDRKILMTTGAIYDSSLGKNDIDDQTYDMSTTCYPKLNVDNDMYDHTF